MIAGSPSGIAAICAARLGARVLLAEATGCLGGMGTSGLVTAFDPMADGEKPLVGGLMREIVETLYARGELGPQVTPDFWRKHYHRWTPFRVEGLKLLLDELAAALAEADHAVIADIWAGRDPDTSIASARQAGRMPAASGSAVAVSSRTARAS